MTNKRSTGSSLLTVVVIMMFVAMLTVALLAAVSASVRTQSAAQLFDEDYYSAESGMNLAVALLCGADNPAGRFYPDGSGAVSYTVAAAQFTSFIEGIPQAVTDFGVINGHEVQISAEIIAAPGEILCHDGFALGAYTVRLTSVCGARVLFADLRVSPAVIDGSESGYTLITGAAAGSAPGLADSAQSRRSEIQLLYTDAQDVSRPYVTVNNAQDAYAHRGAEYLRFGSSYTVINGSSFPNAKYIRADGAIELSGQFNGFLEIVCNGSLTITAGSVLAGAESAMIYAGNLHSGADVTVYTDEATILRGFDLACRRFRVASASQSGALTADARVFCDSVDFGGMAGKSFDMGTDYAGQYYGMTLTLPDSLAGSLHGVFAARDAVTVTESAALYRQLPERVRAFLDTAGAAYTGSGGNTATLLRADYVAPVYRSGFVN